MSRTRWTSRGGFRSSVGMRNYALNGSKETTR